jgi:trigger factor
MNVAARSSGPWEHTLSVEVPVEEVQQRLDEVAREIQRRASLPGFRVGRVPLDLVRQHFADAVEQRFLESFVPKVATEAVDQARLNPVLPPLVRNLHFTPGQPLKLEAVVQVKPEVKAQDYRGLPARRHARAVDDGAVERVLADLRESSAVFEDLDRPAERGDVVLVDSTRIDANGRRLASTRVKARRVELGAPDLLPDLENGLLGATAGQERTIEIAYPADYGVAELAGQTARYAVKVRKIQAKKLRPLDDNLAREVFQLESIDELRSRIRLNLEGEERVRVRRELEQAIANELVDRNPVELPDRMIDWMLDRVIQEATEGRAVPDALRKDLESRYRPGVIRSLQRELLLESVARQERLEVSDEEVAAEIERLVQAEPRHAARVRARYQAAARRQALRESLLERKALDWLIDAAVIQDEQTAEAPLIVPATR